MNDVLVDRSAVGHARRIVVKIGSSSLTRPDGALNLDQIAITADTLAQRVKRGSEVVLVSSGAIAAGRAPLGLTEKPRDLATAQAVASVGQGRLVSHYADEFTRHRVRVGQVLLTAEDLVRRQTHVNAARAIERLLGLGAVPIINENDTVARDDVRFGDNDRLAALTANLIRADVLILLTDVDGLYDGPPSRPGAKLISEVTDHRQLENLAITPRGSNVGTGGMVTKVAAAVMATTSGIPVLLTSANNMAEALEGAPVGTWFAATGPRQPSRRLWLAHASKSQGAVWVDDGAAKALKHHGRSLLAAGITRSEGSFESGDVIDIVDATGEIARGIVAYSSKELAQTIDKPAPIGRTRPVVHRDDMALLPRP